MSTYISIDIETDGPAPGINHMLSLGAVAYNTDGEELGRFQANLDFLSDLTPDEKTMEWWRSQPIAAWEAAREGSVHPLEAMHRFRNWVRQVGTSYVPIAYPASFDFAFVNYYAWRFLGENPLGFSCRDIGSFMAGVFGIPPHEFKASKLPAWVMEDLPPLTHKAVDDAHRQGVMFFRVLNHSVYPQS